MKVLSYLRRYKWWHIPSIFVDYKSRKKGYLAAFISAMNEKTASIGACSASFLDPSGLKYSGATASSRDILQILVYAAGIPQIAEKWGKDRYTMLIQGHNARRESITTTLANPAYNSLKYPIVGGKTGTITAAGHINYNLAWITCIGGTEMACVIMGCQTDKSRWHDAESLVEYLDLSLHRKSADARFEAPRFAVCKMPVNPKIDTVTLFASKSPDETGIPASLTKLMTLVTAYDYILDENELVRIVPSDLIGGSGDNLSAGDIVSIRDLAYDMLLPSSNCAAMALARHIGAKILKDR